MQSSGASLQALLTRASFCTGPCLKTQNGIAAVASQFVLLVEVSAFLVVPRSNVCTFAMICRLYPLMGDCHIAQVSGIIC